MQSNIRVGALVDVTIRKHLPIGLLVDMGNGTEGIVRTREISWQREDHTAWQELFPPGSRQKALALKEGERNWELSLRLVERDPWRTIHQKYQVGKLCEGVVVDAIGRRIFIELEPGVTAALAADRLPDDVAADLDAHFWPGDRVRAEIFAIDGSKREIDLTMRAMDSWRWNGSAQVSRGAARPDDNSIIDPVSPLPLELAASGRQFSVLLVEDDPEQLEAIAHWLRNSGHMVAAVLTAEEALNRLRSQVFELLISDVNLPGMDGIALAQHVKEIHPGIRSALVTDWSTSDLRRTEIDALGLAGAGLILKPALPEDILRFLADSPAPAADAAPDDAGDRLVVGQRVELRRRRPLQDEQRSVVDLLRKLRKETRAAKSVLLRLDMNQRRFQLVGEDGAPTLEHQALSRLIYSPAREVAEDDVIVEVTDALDVAAYVQHLSPLVGFRSCVGVPVPCQRSDRYALFLFHPQAGFGGASVISAAQAVAAMLGAALERQAFLLRAAEMQRLELMGHLTRALVHETNHHLSPLVFALDELRCQCNRLERTLEKEPAAAGNDMRQAQETLAKLSQSIHHLIGTTKMFGRVTTYDQDELVRVDRVVTRCHELLRDMADRAHVRIALSLPNHILLTRARQTQLQQVLLNVMVNAIQQIELLRPKTGGELHVEVAPERREDGAFIRIVVEDDGPGIHTRMLESIFELGVTTRKEGSGMGLYLARRLAEDLGGSLEVEESAALWGTRMAIRVPIHFSK